MYIALFHNRHDLPEALIGIYGFGQTQIFRKFADEIAHYGKKRSTLSMVLRIFNDDIEIGTLRVTRENSGNFAAIVEHIEDLLNSPTPKTVWY